MGIATINPATGQTIKTFQALSGDGVDKALNRARDAYERSRPVREAALENEEFTTDDLRQAQA